MRTNLDRTIKTIEEAKAYLSELHKNGEAYHPEDDARDIEWSTIPEDQRPNAEEMDKLNILMDDIYLVSLDEFDPCEFILSLEFNAEKKEEDGQL